MAFFTVSCDESLSNEEADQKAKETFVSANTENAVGIQYLNSDPASRGFKGEGYYVVFQDGSIEPFGIRNSKGKMQKIGIHDLHSHGSVLFIHPDWEDCCDAIGRGNGKTTEEANYLSILFRQFVIDTKTGKVYTLPTDNYNMFYADKTILGDDGNIYGCDNMTVLMLDTRNFTLNNIPTSVGGKVAYLDNGVLLVGSDNQFEVIFPNRQHKVVYENIRIFGDIIIGVTEGNLSIFKIDGNDVSKTILGDHFLGELIYNPIKKTVICAQLGNHDYDTLIGLGLEYYQYDGNELTPIDFSDDLWQFLSTSQDIRDNKVYRIDVAKDNELVIKILDFNTLDQTVMEYPELSNFRLETFDFFPTGEHIYRISGMNLNNGSHEIYAIRSDLSIVKLSSTDQYTSSPLIPFN